MARKTKTAEEIVDEKSDADQRGHGDNRFRKTFVVQIQGKTQDDQLAYGDGLGDKQAVLQEALNRGLHPKGEPIRESVERIHEGLSSATIKVVYSVPVVPAALDYDPGTTWQPLDVGKPRTEDDRRDEVRKAKLRAQGDPAGFDAA
jgi:hypothetical protein